MSRWKGLGVWMDGDAGRRRKSRVIMAGGSEGTGCEGK